MISGPFNVGGRDVELEYSLGPKSEDEGTFDRESYRISVLKSFRHRNRLRECADTVAHELFHAFLQQSGIHYLLEEDHEEALVRASEHMLWPALRQLAREEQDAEEKTG